LPGISIGQSAKQIKDIPSEVLQPCFDANGRLAEINASFNATDVYWDSKPHSRLVDACRQSEDLWIVSCEIGGRGHHFMKVVAKRSNGKWIKPIVERGISPPRLNCK